MATELEKVLAALKEIKDSQEAIKTSQEASQEEIKEMKSGQEKLQTEIKAGQDRLQEEIKAELKAGQDNLKEEMKNEIQKGQDRLQEEMKAGQVEMKKALEEKFSAVESRIEEIEAKVNKIDVIEGKVNKIDLMEEKVNKIDDIEENVNKIKEIGDKVTTLEESMEEKIQKSLEKKVDEKCDQKIEDNFLKKIEEKVENRLEDNLKKKFEQLEDQLKNRVTLEAAPVMPTQSKSSLKVSPYDGKTSWQVYNTQFEIVAEANRWDPTMKACQLASALRGDAADVLQTLPPGEKLDYERLSNALELRFGERCLKESCRIQLKSRHQKPGEGLQELATDIQRLTHLAYPDYPATVKDEMALQAFVEGLRDPDIQRALRLADATNLESALIYALKFEAAQQSSRRERHPVRGVSARESSPSISDLQKLIENMQKELRGLKDGKSRKIQCWHCGRENHTRRNCPERRPGANAILPEN